MAPRLAADGLVFVGLDFIGERLTEVNVTSPTGIQELSRATWAATSPRTSSRGSSGASTTTARCSAASRRPRAVGPMPITVIVRSSTGDESRLTFDAMQRVVVGPRIELRRAPPRPEREPPPRVAPGARGRLRARRRGEHERHLRRRRARRPAHVAHRALGGRRAPRARVARAAHRPDARHARPRRGDARPGARARRGGAGGDGHRPDDPGARRRGARPGRGPRARRGGPRLRRRAAPRSATCPWPTRTRRASTRRS